MTTSDACSLLGIKPPASAEEVKKAWKNKLKQHHPDKGGDVETCKKLNQAYEKIKSGVKSFNDTSFVFESKFSGFGGVDFNSVYEEFFRKADDNWYHQKNNEPKYHDSVTIKMDDWVHGKIVETDNGMGIRFPQEWRYGADIRANHPTIKGEKILLRVHLNDDRYRHDGADRITIVDIKITVIDKAIGDFEYNDPVFGQLKFKLDQAGPNSYIKIVSIGGANKYYRLFAQTIVDKKPIPNLILAKLKALNEELKKPKPCEF